MRSGHARRPALHPSTAGVRPQTEEAPEKSYAARMTPRTLSSEQSAKRVPGTDILGTTAPSGSRTTRPLERLKGLKVQGLAPRGPI